jgi:protein O-mannosyl-transferase
MSLGRENDRSPGRRQSRRERMASRKAADRHNAARQNGRLDFVPPSPSHQAGNARLVLAICLLLVLAVVLVFGQTVGHQFVNYDDQGYVYKNPHVLGGLTWTGIHWVFTNPQVGNWQPLTGISHLLDCQFFGLWAGGHHLTSIVLHAAAAVVLFLVLWRMTGSVWAVAFMAAVFAVHP